MQYLSGSQGQHKQMSQQYHNKRGEYVECKSSGPGLLSSLSKRRIFSTTSPDTCTTSRHCWWPYFWKPDQCKFGDVNLTHVSFVSYKLTNICLNTLSRNKYNMVDFNSFWKDNLIKHCCIDFSLWPIRTVSISWRINSTTVCTASAISKGCSGSNSS